MSLLAFSRWCEDLAISGTIRNSVWMFAVVQAIHLCVLAVLAGATLIVDLRLLGRGLKDQPVAQVARDAQPWLVWGFFGMVLTGVPQYITNAFSRYYASPIFWWKMGILVLAVIFTFTVRRKVALADEARVGPVWGKVVGLVSILLWASVTIGGRAIGFF